MRQRGRPGKTRQGPGEQGGSRRAQKQPGNRGQRLKRPAVDGHVDEGKRGKGGEDACDERPVVGWYLSKRPRSGAGGNAQDEQEEQKQGDSSQRGELEVGIVRVRERNNLQGNPVRLSSGQIV